MRLPATAKPRTLCLAIVLSLLLLAIAVPRWNPSSGSDFSSFWIAAWWSRERPADTPLYYPRAEPGRINERIWTKIRSDHDGRLLEPWRAMGMAHGFRKPKFFLYPAVFAYALQPLTWLDPDIARLVWNSLNGLSWLLAGLILAAACGTRTQPYENIFLAYVLISVPSYPWHWSLDLGQCSLLVLLPFVVLITTLRRDGGTAAPGSSPPWLERRPEVSRSACSQQSS